MKPPHRTRGSLRRSWLYGMMRYVAVVFNNIAVFYYAWYARKYIAPLEGVLRIWIDENLRYMYVVIRSDWLRDGRSFENSLEDQIYGLFWQMTRNANKLPFKWYIDTRISHNNHWPQRGDWIIYAGDSELDTESVF